MRYFIIVFLLFTQNVFAKNYCVMLTPQQEKILEDIIVDIQTWIDLAVAGKLNKSEERVIRKEFLDSIAEGSNIPNSDLAIINKRFQRPDYKNREEREKQKREKILGN